jgi:hypothetical protein
MSPSVWNLIMACKGTIGFSEKVAISLSILTVARVYGDASLQLPEPIDDGSGVRLWRIRFP